MDSRGGGCSAVALGFLFRISPMEWIAVVIVIGMVCAIAAAVVGIIIFLPKIIDL